MTAAEEIGTCVACGAASANLSSLGRCFDCITQAGREHQARVDAEDARLAYIRGVCPKCQRVRGWAHDAPGQCKPKPERRPVVSSSSYDPGRLSAYAAKALAEEVSTLLGTQPGGRNHALNVAAFSLGQLVAAGHLDEGEVTEQLRDAALAIGLTESETEKTLRSGLEAGMSQPREVALTAPAPQVHETTPEALVGAQSGPHEPQGAAAASPEERRSSWQPLDLGATIDGLLSGTLSRPKPTIGAITGGGFLFYAGRVNGIAGESNSGKTWTALVVAAQQLAAGAVVVYIDMEDDAVGILSRLLLDLGADPDVVRERFVYLTPTERLGRVEADLLSALLAERRPTLVIVDSTGEALALQGARPNDDDEVARFFKQIPAPIARTGACVIVLDHVAKADDDGLWPIGSQRKRAAITGVQLMQRTSRPFSRGQPGSAVLRCAKDRHGTYSIGQKVGELVISPGTGHAVIDLKAIDGQAAATPWRPTVLMERVSRYLEENAEASSARTRTQIRTCVEGKERDLLKALGILVTEGFVTTMDGPRNSVICTSLRPYRRENDPQEAGARVEPLNVSPDGVTRARAYKRGTGHGSLSPVPGTGGARVGTGGHGSAEKAEPSGSEVTP